jgi:hypothetical protein
MPRTVALIVLLAGLSACTQTQVPDSGAGVGFGDYDAYLADRERALRTGGPAPVPPSAAARVSDGTAPVPTATGSGFSVEGAGAAIDAAAGTTGAAVTPGALPDPNPPAIVVTDASQIPAVTSGTRPRGNAPAGIQEQSGEVAAVRDNVGISDEQDFAAVSARETIQSDAERIQQNRDQYVQIAPGALPTRPSDTGPNIVQFAPSTDHAVGTEVYRRSGGGGDWARACANFASPDLAQEAFLERGGPDRDRMGVDPDGDGFACTWDPRPFRAAAGRN